jgi:outer membrane protein
MQRPPQSRLRLLAIIPMGALAGWSVAAHAQSQDDNHAVIGLGTGLIPVYEGSAKYKVTPVPMIDIKYGPFFADLRNGIGLDLFQSDHVTIGTSIAYLPGYNHSDVPRGIDKLDTGAGGRVFVNLKGAGFVATLGATKGFAGGNAGTIADASLSHPFTITDRLTLIPSLGTTWTDKKYNDRYFGVDQNEALASGLRQFEAGSGFKDASALLSINYRLTNHINLGVSAGVTTMLGDDKDSPLVIHKTQPTGFWSLSYRFGS